MIHVRDRAKLDSILCTTEEYLIQRVQCEGVFSIHREKGRPDVPNLSLRLCPAEMSKATAAVAVSLPRWIFCLLLLIINFVTENRATRPHVVDRGISTRNAERLRGVTSLIGICVSRRWRVAGGVVKTDFIHKTKTSFRLFHSFTQRILSHHGA